MLQGPWLPDPRRPQKMRRSWLYAFLDDHSRLCLHGRFSFKGDLPALELVFRRSLQKYGVPRRVYYDNGAVYHPEHMRHIVACLGIEGITFTRPRQDRGLQPTRDVRLHRRGVCREDQDDGRAERGVGRLDGRRLQPRRARRDLRGAAYPVASAARGHPVCGRGPAPAGLPLAGDPHAGQGGCLLALRHRVPGGAQAGQARGRGALRPGEPRAGRGVGRREARRARATVRGGAASPCPGGRRAHHRPAAGERELARTPRRQATQGELHRADAADARRSPR